MMDDDYIAKRVAEHKAAIAAGIIPSPMACAELVRMREEADAAELQWFRKREQWVQALLNAVSPGAMLPRDMKAIRQWMVAVDEQAIAVRDFELTPSVKCPSQADGQGDDLTPAAQADASESHGKTPSDAG